MTQNDLRKNQCVRIDNCFVCGVGPQEAEDEVCIGYCPPESEHRSSTCEYFSCGNCHNRSLRKGASSPEIVKFENQERIPKREVGTKYRISAFEEMVAMSRRRENSFLDQLHVAQLKYDECVLVTETLEGYLEHEQEVLAEEMERDQNLPGENE